MSVIPTVLGGITQAVADTGLLGGAVLAVFASVFAVRAVAAPARPSFYVQGQRVSRRQFEQHQHQVLQQQKFTGIAHTGTFKNIQRSEKPIAGKTENHRDYPKPNSGKNNQFKSDSLRTKPAKPKKNTKGWTAPVHNISARSSYKSKPDSKMKPGQIIRKCSAHESARLDKSLPIEYRGFTARQLDRKYPGHPF